MTVGSTQPSWSGVGVLVSSLNGDSNTHTGNDSGTWRGMIGRNSLADLKSTLILNGAVK